MLLRWVTLSLLIFAFGAHADDSNFVFTAQDFSLGANPIQKRQNLELAYRRTMIHSLPVSATISVGYQPEAKHLYAGCALDSPCPPLLFVMLPGTNGLPSDATKVLRAIAASGMAALGLAYQTGANRPGVPAAAAQCLNDDRCYGDFRRDRVMGARSSRYVLSPSDGILPRLLAALKALGWSDYYNRKGLRFERMVFAGGSQGAGMAAWIGKHYKVRRVVQFAGTSDATQNAMKDWIPASWTRGPNQTPSTDFFAFVHLRDPYFPRDQVVWRELGMEGKLTLWNNPGPQKLFTDLPNIHPDCNWICAHGQVVGDGVTPDDPNGLPLFLETWAKLGNPNY